MQKINVIIFAQVSHSYVATSIHQCDAWYEFIYIEEVVEQAATKHDHESQLPLDSTLVQSQPLKATATESM